MILTEFWWILSFGWVLYIYISFILLWYWLILTFVWFLFLRCLYCNIICCVIFWTILVNESNCDLLTLLLLIFCDPGSQFFVKVKNPLFVKSWSVVCFNFLKYYVLFLNNKIWQILLLNLTFFIEKGIFPFGSKKWEMS